ncbi:MAG: GrpE protein [Xanthobacteraceae bacterium]|nr:GrpE protein [Xanthobacteraceae bacterium]
MTDPTARANAAAAAQTDEVEAQANAAPEALAPEQQAVDPAEALAREAAEFKDKLLRTLAEMENLRRRTEREVADARSYGVAGFARDILGVADNMRRALEAIPPELRASKDAQVLIEGVELTERELAKALEKNGVRKFDPQGAKFDPNIHQAMYEVPDPSVPAGFVAQVMQPGYMIGDRVLRPAFVGVSKGAAKVAPGGDATNAAAEPSPGSQGATGS